MAKYSDIKGFTVQTLASDTVASQAEGGSWASGGDLNTARSSVAGAGTQTAAIMFGGNTPAPGPYPQPYYLQDETESYNGTSFTEVADLNTARGANRGGFGTSTAGFLAGGYTYPPAGPTGAQQICESWNGSAWSETTDFNTKRYSFGCSVSAPYTNSIITGGYTGGPPPSQINDAVETWNGSSWTETTETNSTKGGGSGAGTSSTAAIVVGPTNSTVESWDGSSWTEVAEMTTTRSSTGSAGTYTSALWFGGPSSSAKTEFWNGTSWTELNDLSTGRSDLGAAGGSSGSTSSLAAGGTGVVAVSEEWDAPAVFNQIHEGQLFFNSTTNAFKETILDLAEATWASGGSLNTARRRLVGTGLQTAALALNGIPPSPGISNVVEQYDGSSWTEVAEANTARIDAMAVGTSTDAYFIGGSIPTGSSPVYKDLVESWNGSSWTETTEFNTARDNAGNAGSTSAAIIFGGNNGPPFITNTEVWNGSAWTEVNDMNTARENFGSAAKGTTTATLGFGGNNNPSAPYTAKTESWDGTNWTEVSDLNTARNSLGGAGIQIAALAFGGNTPPYTGKTENWNGSTWTERADLSTSRYAAGAGGASSASAIYFGGDTTAPVANTEEWTADLANKTITAS